MDEQKPEDVVGRTIASVKYAEDGLFTVTDLTVVFTDGSTWEISTCSCCGLSDDLKEPKDG